MPRPLHFNPRPPRGGRRGYSRKKTFSGQFQSTPSARRATILNAAAPEVLAISIHALREAGDKLWDMLKRVGWEFQSTPSARRATQIPIFCIVGYKFQSTPSARRATRYLYHCQCTGKNFNPRPPRGGRLDESVKVCNDMYDFNPRPPRGGRLPLLCMLHKIVGDFNPRPPRGGRP